MVPIDENYRPYPIPSTPWAMTQTWRHLLFAHWPVQPENLNSFIPSPLRLDTYDGLAYISVVPFDMTHIRMRFLPPIPKTTAFAELNVRTYVIHKNKPGVWFFSLDAANPLAVWAARTFVHLPYFHAGIQIEQQGSLFTYHSTRYSNGARFEAKYQPIGDVYVAESGTLDYWLTARYCLYSAKGTAIYRCDIDHCPWPLQPANADVHINDVGQGFGFNHRSAPPLVSYAESLTTHIWLPERIQ